MTLEEISILEREILTPAEVAPVLGMDRHTLHLCARQAPERLGFPVIVAGSRVKIPKRPFLRFMLGE